LRVIAKFDSSFERRKAPAHPPFAAYSGARSDTNIFDLSQKSLGRAEGRLCRERLVQPRTICISRCVRATPSVAPVLRGRVRLAPLDRPKDGNFYLSDGRVTLMIIPWKITDY